MSGPLWEVMRHAYDQSSVPTALIESSDPETGDCLTDRYGYAAEIRALADWIEQRQLGTYAVVIPDVAEVIDWLRAEAERAEGR
jgi:hypothetical protein